MANVAPGTAVDAPPLSAPVNGLLRAAPIDERADGKWLGGISWDPEACPAGVVADLCDLTDMDLTTARRAGMKSSMPFLAQAFDECSSFGWQTAEYEARARRKLTAIESALVEAEFWAGGLNQNNAHLSIVDVNGTNEVQTLTVDATGGTYTLTFDGQTTAAIAEAATSAAVQSALRALSNIDTADVTVTGSAGGPYTITFSGKYATMNVSTITTDPALLTGGAGTAVITTTTPGVAPTDGANKVTSSAVTPLQALSLLEQGLADNKCGQGMIHARPRIVTLWLADGALIERNGKLYTATGHVVVPGVGYPGTGPNDEAVSTDSEWAYATEMVGIVTVPQTQVQVFGADQASSLNRGTNTFTMIAQRPYAIQWSQCCWLAAQIDPTP